MNMLALIEREIDALATEPCRVIRAVEVSKLIRDARISDPNNAELTRLEARLFAEGFGLDISKETA